ncbi:NAD(P)H-binding protein [Rhizobium sp. 32-5/1]|uniref:NAD-dependent epimerase/dehydratase family protein n=1 Tax=Rhizobium sp. 32-5/1 TaxID=3019602 RepID=UPI00240E1F55|nr:NAD-dependent epimerase/dehydratase family protein [Rhizobium sp. 32-5/1]WEZ82961.1 NAD(P)H-binding protein [Rhizobium sp. 32-5/1]
MTNGIEHKQPIALVLGATGGIGGEVARKLKARGWAVRALNRNAAKAAATNPDFEWLNGDAMNAFDLLRAARGVDLIVHAVNPPGYAKWGSLVLPMIDNTIAAARANGATVLLPGTIYNYGPDAFPLLSEEAPQNPTTVKGGIRVEMERRLKAASEDGVRVIILRAGDFFGATAVNSWFSQGMVTPGKPLTSITYPGKAGTGHQWAYLPDVAEIMLRLVERRDRLPPFATFHMTGFWDDDGTKMVAAIRRVTGRPDLRVKSFPWWLLPLAAPFVTFLRELREMRYLWKEPLRMPNARLVETIGAEPWTPIDTAVRTTLAALGCLPADARIVPGKLLAGPARAEAAR